MEKFFGLVGFVLEKKWEIRLLSNLTFENFIPKLSLSIEKIVACTPYLVTYLLQIEQYLEKMSFYFLSVIRGERLFITQFCRIKGSRGAGCPPHQ